MNGIRFCGQEDLGNKAAVIYRLSANGADWLNVPFSFIDSVIGMVFIGKKLKAKAFASTVMMTRNIKP